MSCKNEKCALCKYGGKCESEQLTFTPATKEQLIDRLDRQIFQYYKQDMAAELKNRYNYTYVFKRHIVKPPPGINKTDVVNYIKNREPVQGPFDNPLEFNRLYQYWQSIYAGIQGFVPEGTMITIKCRQCAHYDERRIGEKLTGICKRTGYTTTENDFCSSAEVYAD